MRRLSRDGFVNLVDHMPLGTPPPELLELLHAPNPCVVATIRPDGDPHTAPTWYELQDDGTILLNMTTTRRRLEHLHANPRVALTVFIEESWYRHISLIGRVVEIRPDPDLADIDRLAVRYTGAPYRDRERDSVTAIVQITRWHGWRDHDLTQPA